MSIVRRTRSLCPHCLRVIDARYVADIPAQEEYIFLEKYCPEHGHFRVPAWLAQPGIHSFAQWKNATPSPISAISAASSTADERKPRIHGCPLDCGLCKNHAQLTCCALVEVTTRCNLHCPVCYANAGKESRQAVPASNNFETDPSLQDIAHLLTLLKSKAGAANVQLSGGEPTVRNDVPEIITLIHAMGFPFVQLNTNGLRLGREPGYAATLKKAGLNVVYLQWDGMRAETFQTLRGLDCRKDKEKALFHCREAHLPVVLVATVVPGINDDEMGAVLHKALSCGPLVRGLHVQPAASFGRSPWAEDMPRLTLPEVMTALEKQSSGLVRAAHFTPPGSEHALCSFSALYQREGEGLTHIPGGQSCCCEPRSEAHQARDFVAQHWGTAENAASSPDMPCDMTDGLSTFLAGSGLRQRFTLSGMAFQDAYTLDLERTRRCHIHVVSKEKGLVPFCLYNMTSMSGFALHRKE